MRRWQQLAAAFAVLLVGLAFTGCGGGIEGEETGTLNIPNRPLSFERVNVGGEAIQTFTLENSVEEGGGSVTIQNMRLIEREEDEARELVPVNPQEMPLNEEFSIAPGESRSWDIAYRPENAIQDSGEISFVVQNDPSYDDPSESVELITREMNAEVNIVPSNVNFSTDPDETGYNYSVVRSTGQAPINVENIAIAGSDKFSVSYAHPSEVNCDIGRTSPFPEVSIGDIDNDGEEEFETKSVADVEKITPESQENLWPVDGLKESFDPQECFVPIFEFNPVDQTPETASVSLTMQNTEPQTQSISLAGNSDKPCLEISTGDALQFGVTSVGQMTPQTVRIRNCRSQADPLVISEIQLGNDEGVFAIDRASLPGGQELINGDTDPNTGGLSLEGDEQITYIMEATPDIPQKIGSADCDPETDPVMKVFTNDESLEGGVKDVCMTVTGDSNQCPTAVAECRVKARGSGGGSMYSTDIDTLPLETLQCTGQDSSDSDGSINRFEWTIVERPDGSGARFQPGPNVSEPQIFLDLAGEYVFELKVFDNKGLVSCGEPSRVTVEAIPDEDIHGQLIWDTPSDPNQQDDRGTDLDLHFVNPHFPSQQASWSWNQSPYDIYWDNQTEDWGTQGDPSDDPSLDIDDRDGAGPENINLDEPTFGTPYKWGVYYFRDNGFGESYATLRIFLLGELAQEYKNKYLPSTDTFWYAADVVWQGENSRILKRDIIYKDGFPTN